MFFEEFAERMDVSEPRCVGYFAEAHGTVLYHAPCLEKSQIIDVTVNRLSGVILEETAEVSHGNPGFVTDLVKADITRIV